MDGVIFGAYNESIDRVALEIIDGILMAVTLCDRNANTLGVDDGIVLSSADCVVDCLELGCNEGPFDGVGLDKNGDSHSHIRGGCICYDIESLSFVTY